MRLRFQADNDLNRAIIEGLRRREPSVSFQTAAQAKFDRLPDREVLRRAANENRVLVSHDLNTLLPEFQAFTEAVSSPGLVLIPQRLSIGLLNRFCCCGQYPSTMSGGIAFACCRRFPSCTSEFVD